ncbi:tetratricopeptide repeat protein [Chitinophaga tropicalis]|nr:tetratricopeptide repeat protein [Chitinophaga tropicalis]
MRILISCVMTGSLFFSAANAQTISEQALAKGREATQLMDDGKIEESIVLLKEAQQMDPENNLYTYEIALARYRQQNYKAVIDLLKPLTKKKNCDAQIYQMLGNAYDDGGNPEKAIATYEKGMKIFPDAGRLYVERGLMEMKANDYNKALKFFEMGIKVDPMYPSNYYRAAKIFLDSDQEVWGMIYGEIFVNLERNTKRTEEISKLLYTTYKGEIKFTNDTSFAVSFCKNNTTIYLDDKAKKKDRLDNLMAQMTAALTLSYGSRYELAMAKAITGEKIINLSSLNRIRDRFLDVYQADSLQSVVLFDYQRKIRDAGHLEAYNYWILAQAGGEEAEMWISAHEQQWKDFIEWFRNNRIDILPEKAFYRLKYIAAN